LTKTAVSKVGKKATRWLQLIFGQFQEPYKFLDISLIPGFSWKVATLETANCVRLISLMNLYLYKKVAPESTLQQSFEVHVHAQRSTALFIAERNVHEVNKKPTTAGKKWILNPSYH